MFGFPMQEEAPFECDSLPEAPFPFFPGDFLRQMIHGRKSLQSEDLREWHGLREWRKVEILHSCFE